MSAVIRSTDEGRVAIPIGDGFRELPVAERVLSAILRRWRILTFAAILGAGAGVGASFLMPAWYESTASFAVIPIDDPTGPTSAPADSTGAVLPLFSHVLVSRRVADATAAQLNLRAVYGKSSPEATRRELLKHVSVSTDRKANVVVLSVEDRSPAQARVIANALQETARALNTEIWSGRGTEHRKRLEARFAEVTTALAAAEEAMRKFRDREHVVDLPEQIKASVAEAAFLARMKTEKRLGLHFAQGFGGAEAPEVQRSRAEAGGAQAALQGLVHGGQRIGPMLALDDLPRLEREHAQLKRDIDVNAATYELLARQVEQLRAVEARPGGRIEVVDAPSEPQTRSRPSRSTMGLEGMLLGLLLGLGLVIRPRAVVALNAITLPRRLPPRLDPPEPAKPPGKSLSR